MGKSWGWTLLGLVAVLAPVVAIAMIVQVRYLSPTSIKQAAVPVDQAIPIAASDADKDSSSSSQKDQPGTISLPTIEELTPRSAPINPSAASKVAMPATLSDPYVASIESTSANEPVSPGSGNVVNSQGTRRREGSNVRDLVGTISKQGLHIVFTPSDNSAPMNLLENQLLERIESFIEAGGPAVAGAPWRISGRVTEYRGTNYILLNTASQIDSKARP